MSETKLTREERETVLIYNEAEGKWLACTGIAAHQRRFERCGWKLVEDLGYEKGYEAPRNALTFRNFKKMLEKKPMTEGQKKILTERLAQNRNKNA